MFKSVRNKLLIINLVTISVLMLIAFVFIYGITRNNINTDNQDRLLRIPMNNNYYLRDPNHMEDDRRYESDSNTSFNLLLDENGNIEKIGSYLELDTETYEEVINDIFVGSESRGEIVIDDRIWLYQVSEVKKVDYNDFLIDYDITIGDYRVSFLDITDSREYLDNLLLLLTLIALITLIIIYFISLYFANKSIKPLEVMWQKQREFVANATHELKTPLTIISANTDVLLLDESKTIKKQKKWIDYIKGEVTGMNDLINELLNSAKVEEEKYLFDKVNISEVVEDCILSFETLIYEKKIKFNIDIEKDLVVNTDCGKYLQVVRILLDNALKYTNEDGNINVKLSRVSRKVELEISNTGAGINNQDLPHIFDRFYKCDKSRTNRGSSYGLGLYIAKSIIAKLHGSISCTSDDVTKFIVRI